MILAWMGSMGIPQAPQTQAPKPTPEVAAILERASQAAKAKRNDEAQRLYDEALAKAREASDAAGCAAALKRSGDLYNATDDRAKARERFEQAIPFFHQVGDASGEAWTLRELSIARFLDGQRQKAREAGEAGLQLFRTLGDRKGEATILAELAQIVTDPEQAKVYLEAALKVFRDLGQTRNQAMILVVLGNNVHALTDPVKAMACLEEALGLARQAKDPDMEANVLMCLGNHTEDSAKATSYFTQALEIFERLGNKQGRAVVLANFGNALSRAGRKREALERHEQALEIKRSLGDKNQVAISLANIAGLTNQLGEPDKALQLLDQARALFEETEDPVGVAQTMRISAGVLTDLGEHEQAIELCRKAAAALAKFGDKYSEADAIQTAGHAYSIMDRTAEAAECFDRALSVFGQIKHVRGQARVLRELALLMDDVGQPERALEYLHRAQALMRSVNDESEMGFASQDIAGILRVQGRHREAVLYYEQARSLCRQSGNKSDEALVVADMAAVRVDEGRFEGALKLLEEASALLEGTTGNYHIAILHYRKGLALQGARRWNEAIAEFSTASKLFGDWGDRPQEIDSFTRLGEVFDSMGRPGDAERELRRAVHVVETQRESLGAGSASPRYVLQAAQRAYGRLIALLWRQGRFREAFETCQGAKARALLALMGGAKADLSKSLTAQESNQERTLRQKASYLTSRLTGEAEGRGAEVQESQQKLKADLKEAEQRLQWFYDNLEKRHPELGRRRPAKPASAAEVGNFLSEDAAVLEYSFLCSDNDTAGLHRTLLFVVTKAKGQPSVKSYEIAITHDALDRAVANLRESCSDRRKPWRAQASALFTKLLAPAAKELAGKKRLLICPDGPLWDLPFQVLVDGRNKCLIERFEVNYAYSASAARAVLSAVKDPKSATLKQGPLVIANPDFGTKAVTNAQVRTRAAEVIVPRGSKLVPLPGTEREANAIRRLFPGSLTLAGANAQEASVKKHAGGYRYLHFGTHGFVNDAAPMLSSLALARPSKGSDEDGFLTAMEISNMSLPADLVVLSACSTGGGEVRKGEGVVGLSWALQVAGARSQVLSKWALNDASTATLMAGFYGRLKKGEAKGAALRSAALSLKRDGIHAHPYYWAPFVLLGDWRK